MRRSCWCRSAWPRAGCTETITRFDCPPPTTYIEGYKYSLNGTSGTPTGSFTDPQTTFDEQNGIALDAAGRIYVTSLTENVVDVYAAGAGGSNITPIGTYWDYTASTLNTELTVGPDGKTLYATSCDSDSVAIYPNGASPASRSIVGPNTGLNCPTTIAVDASGTIYVGDDQGVSVFAASASGNVAPIRRMTTALFPGDASGIALGSIALGPGPFSSENASAARGSATSGTARMQGSGSRRSSRSAKRLHGVRPICVVMENARRAMLAKLYPHAHAIPPARHRNPRC